MPAPVSVVIPTLNAASDLPETLACLMEGVSGGLLRDLIISDGGSQDATHAIAAASGARLVTGAPGRGAQIGRGVAQATAPWVMVLHADTHLSDGWSKAVAAHLEKGSDRAGYFSLKFRATGLGPRVVAAGGNARARLFGLPYGDQGLVIARTLLDAVGGYPDLPLMEDVVLAQRLKGRMTPLPATAATGADRYQRNGWLRQSTANLLRLARFRTGLDAATLAKDYDAT
ncbi:TIGR04283 family arsenosugar biosynthesis glycosyltransferase [Pseudoruegeria sp. SK021]|uniref:TIGR04283 family arsenosugar biosynthesis glycosyltransferase n=1 Tax=Pseudoruegeria sp. SK021 TaxID=1933035 RepID=UPI000A225586|nr:TIGR04283 family arsenosugar biosynthesis glycosyltransferase [Pseudoruegeria sp. SK021]OSP56182.1 glycosyl transferase [Pseudoruegeria sp. SK021]